MGLDKKKNISTAVLCVQKMKGRELQNCIKILKSKGMTIGIDMLWRKTEVYYLRHSVLGVISNSWVERFQSSSTCGTSSKAGAAQKTHNRD